MPRGINADKTQALPHAVDMAGRLQRAREPQVSRMIYSINLLTLLKGFDPPIIRSLRFQTAGICTARTLA